MLTFTREFFTKYELDEQILNQRQAPIVLVLRLVLHMISFTGTIPHGSSLRSSTKYCELLLACRKSIHRAINNEYLLIETLSELVGSENYMVTQVAMSADQCHIFFS